MTDVCDTETSVVLLIAVGKTDKGKDGLKILYVWEVELNLHFPIA
jgi:hypothetical protein